MLPLRPYQLACVDAIDLGWQQYRKQIAVLPTGAGKTIIAAHVAKRSISQHQRVMFLAHREELLTQTIDKFCRASGIYAELEKADDRASMQADCVVASVQTMLARSDRWPVDHFGLIIVDEAHHALADSYQRVLGRFDRAKVLGITATPDRGDKRNLGVFFENIAYEIPLFDLVHQQYLSKIVVQAVPLQIDITGVKQSAGDYDAAQLGDALTPYLCSIADAIAEHCAFRRTLAFLPLRSTSKAFVEACLAAGLSACHIDGDSPDRHQIISEFASGKYDVLSNAMLLTEGFDDPGIDCVVVLRMTRSRALYSQMVGRGTRVAPCKRDLLLLDFLWMHERHNLIRPAHLVAPSDEIAQDMTEEAFEVAQNGGGESQVPLDLEGLASDTQIKREEKLRKALEEKSKRKAKYIDALEFCLQIHDSETAEWEDTMRWHSDKPTDGQIKMLTKYGFDANSIRSKGHASAVINSLINRSRLGLATPKQMRLLSRLGHPSPASATFESASGFIDARLRKPKSDPVLF